MIVKCTKREELELTHVLSRTCEVSVAYSNNDNKIAFTTLAVHPDTGLILHIIGEIVEDATDKPAL